jgi:hypothetical protein
MPVGIGLDAGECPWACSVPGVPTRQACHAPSRSHSTDDVIDTGRTRHLQRESLGRQGSPGLPALSS